MNMHVSDLGMKRKTTEIRMNMDVSDLGMKRRRKRTGEYGCVGFRDETEDERERMNMDVSDLGMNRKTKENG